jgi:hypothetical protein
LDGESLGVFCGLFEGNEGLKIAGQNKGTIYQSINIQKITPPPSKTDKEKLQSKLISHPGSLSQPKQQHKKPLDVHFIHLLKNL